MAAAAVTFLVLYDLWFPAKVRLTDARRGAVRLPGGHHGSKFRQARAARLEWPAERSRLLTILRSRIDRAQRRLSALYDPASFAALGATLVPESGSVYYLPVYGPQVSILFAPFALLPYGWALLVWILITTAIYGICCWAVWSTCPHLRNEGPPSSSLRRRSPPFSI